MFFIGGRLCYSSPYSLSLAHFEFWVVKTFRMF